MLISRTFVAVRYDLDAIQFYFTTDVEALPYIVDDRLILDTPLLTSVIRVRHHLDYITTDSSYNINTYG